MVTTPDRSRRELVEWLWAAGWTIPATLIVALYLGCTARKATLGTSAQQVRHHEFWNFYERGLGRMAGKDFAGAQEDFERCLGLRRGVVYSYPRDVWRIRTYGLHVLDSYFPHRELGVALYHQNQFPEAVKYLSASLEHQPSGRAKHFLNEARREQLRRRPPGGMPDIDIAREGITARSRERTITVNGMARARARVEKITVDGEPIFFELAEPERAFGRQVNLEPGLNRIKVEVTDLLGRTTSTNLLCVADFDPPLLQVRRAVRRGPVVRFEAVARDQEGLQEICVNGRKLLEHPKQPVLSFAATFDVASAERATVELRDRAGNISSVELDPEQWGGLMRGDDSGHATPLPERSIQLSQNGSVFQVFGPEFVLDGWVRDTDGVATLEVNQQRVYSDSTSVPALHFVHRVPLEEGTNHLSVVARSMVQVSQQLELTVVRRSPEYESDEIRLCAVLPPFSAIGNGDDVVIDQYHHQLANSLRTDPVRFYLLDRGIFQKEAELERILGASNVAHPGAKIADDKVMTPDLSLQGRKVMHPDGVTIAIETVDAATDRHLFVDDIFISTTDAVTDGYELEGLALKLAQRFPVVEGRVVKISKGRAEINLGRQHGLNPVSRLVVVPPDPEQGNRKSELLRRKEGRFVQLQVHGAGEDHAVASIQPKAAWKQIKEGDFVYAR